MSVKLFEISETACEAVGAVQSLKDRCDTKQQKLILKEFIDQLRFYLEQNTRVGKTWLNVSWGLVQTASRMKGQVLFDEVHEVIQEELKMLDRLFVGKPMTPADWNRMDRFCATVSIYVGREYAMHAHPGDRDVKARREHAMECYGRRAA